MVEAEEVLEGDRREGDVLLLDLHPLLGLDRLVEPVAPAPSRHGPAGELVDDHHLAVADDVLPIELVMDPRPECLVDLVSLHGMLDVEDVGDAGPLLDLGDAVVGERHRLGLLVAGVVLVGDQILDQARVGVVLLGGLAALAADDQRGARLVDEDGVDLVDDGVVEPALDALLHGHRHVVPEVVEAQLVVGRVGDVAGVGLAASAGAEVLQAGVGVALVEEVGVVDEGEVLAGDDPDAHAQEVVDGSVPSRVTAGQVVVDGDQVSALAHQRVQVQGESRHQGLAFAGPHLGDLAVVEHDAPDQLDVEVAHPQDAA